MFQATQAVGCVLGGWLATGPPDGRAGAGRPTGARAARDLAQRNEASIRLGAIPNTVQGCLLPHVTHTQTLVGLHNGPISGLSVVA